MDTSLLSKMVKELILENERVALPGLGSFIAQMIPSSFSDKGYTIHPPYRRLSFRNVPSEDNLLAQLYAHENGVDVELAGKIISDFVEELKTELKSSKLVVFPGLGKLRATRENIFFFIVDEDTDIWPVGSGMQPVTMKSHGDNVQPASVFGTVDVPEEVTSVTRDPELPPEPVSEPTTDPAPEPAPESVPAPEPVLESVPEPVPAPDDATVSTPDSEPAQVSVPENDPDITYRDEEYALPLEPQPQEGQQATAHFPEPYHTRFDMPQPRRDKMFFSIFLIVVASVVFILAVFILLAHFCPDFIDKLLYSPAEQELLRYKR